jgi:hypothetical protein
MLPAINNQETSRHTEHSYEGIQTLARKCNVQFEALHSAPWTVCAFKKICAGGVLLISFLPRDSPGAINMLSLRDLIQAIAWRR